MKYHIKTITMAVMALASIQLARADITTVTNDANVSTWDPVGGNIPFYVTTNNWAGISGNSGQGNVSAGSPVNTKYTVLSETFTITNNGAGMMSAASAGSNWVLTAISMYNSGGSGPIGVHLFDITTNLTSNNGSIYNGSGATYGFSANGDLFGNGLGLTFQNSLPGTRQQTIVLQNGPFSQDQVVLGVNHTYALEFWIATTNPANSFIWNRASFADGGGQGMGSHDGALTTNRLTLASLGAAGAAPRTFSLALFGAPTTNALSSNNLTNMIPPAIYVEDDFSTNGVSDLNPAGADYYPGTNYVYAGTTNISTTVWREWFGNGGPGGTPPPITFNPNVNVSGNTNAHGAMQINFTWNAATDGNQQWLIWHGNANTYVPTNSGGSVGVGFPQWTNIQCAVRYDPSSVKSTGGVYGVIRMLARGVGDFAQPWINSSYTTITDTNWHIINGQLVGTSADALNVADVIVGEDVGNYVPGGLTGNQTLYIDNIQLTGPGGGAVIVLPPPTVGGPTKVTPGLRLFAGPTSTIDRTVVYTQNAMQNSWVNATPAAPVTYSMSLQDYNRNIQQVMIELMGGGTTPTTYGEFADFSGPTTLWLTINPGPTASSVVAGVSWKTNNPGSNPGDASKNPYGVMISFTNSTAVGTWGLVFTGPNNGYVIAPGTVVNGSTNFTINDGTVTSDFADPVFAAFGEQPNNTAGQGAFVDVGFIGITNTAAGVQYEDFTKEGSDIIGGFTPSVQFNNGMSQTPASVIIQTTNDAWWVNWTQPAIGFTLASTTNLLSNQWINPGWYSGYQDTNAPRVMALPVGFGGKFWVLLPKDTVPTAGGQQNPYNGSSGQPGSASFPAAPNAFFRIGTNTVSP
jgi:hypothetical protein